MSQFVLLPTAQAPDKEQPTEVAVDSGQDQRALLDLRLTDGQLVATPRVNARVREEAAGQARGALLCRQPIDGGAEWFLLDDNNQFAINGRSTFGIQRISPGDLISCGGQSWFVTERVVPEPIVVPDSARDKNCPMCGLGLPVAPVVQCVCGRFLHLEAPDSPGDPSALNCFLVSKVCGNCGRPTTLEPQLVPEPPAQVRPFADDDLNLDSGEV